MKKRILSFCLGLILLMTTLVPVAFATSNKVFEVSQSGSDWLIDNDNGTYLFNEIYPNFFYRTRDDDSNISYGYGYGYDSVSGEYAFGYGYGYSYSVLAYAYDYDFDADDSRLGYFLAENDLTSPTSHTFTIPTSGGVATVPMAMTLVGDSSGVEVHIPNGLVMTGTGWDGTITVTNDTDVPAALGDSLSHAVTVNIETGGVAITLSDEMVVVIPYVGFGDLTDGTVSMVNALNHSATINPCSVLQYTGDESSADLVDSDNYSVASGSHCYVYLEDNLYVATRHLTSFTAARMVSSDDTVSSGGTTVTKKTVKKTEAETGATETKVVIKDFNDLQKLTADDWRYKAIDAVVNAGFFLGEVKNGIRTFNMDGAMDRGQAAMVVAKYYGCDTATAPTVSPFKDVPTGAYYSAAIACLKTNGIVAGNSPTTFAPQNPVSRAELFRMLVEAYMLKNPSVKAEWTDLMKNGKNPFVDVKPTDWSIGYMKLANEKNLLSGYDIGGKKYMKGEKTIVRVEGAAMMLRFVGM